MLDLTDKNVETTLYKVDLVVYIEVKTIKSSSLFEDEVIIKQLETKLKEEFFDHSLIDDYFIESIDKSEK